MLRRIISAFVLLGILAAMGLAFGETATAQSQEQPKPAAAPAPAKNDYGNGDDWLCRPGRQDACAVDLTTTVVAANGKMKRKNWAANPKAPIDCFYVYPTVSNDPGGNSGMVPTSQEKGVIVAQFARFASQCRPFAPMYRQITDRAASLACRQSHARRSSPGVQRRA